MNEITLHYITVAFSGREPPRRAPDADIADVGAPLVHGAGLRQQARRPDDIQTAGVRESINPPAGAQASGLLPESQHAQEEIRRDEPP